MAVKRADEKFLDLIIARVEHIEEEAAIGHDQIGGRASVTCDAGHTVGSQTRQLALLPDAVTGDGSTAVLVV